MISLKNIISQLKSDIYSNIEEVLQKNKAGNFLFLMQSYRSGDLSDEEIIDKLALNSNSFYVLKSRLYDKIQGHLAGNILVGKEELLKQIQQIPEMCYGMSRELANAFLLKLEKDLLAYDMHNELLIVYSALKKIHLNSDKYFHYSQAYNKHIAFGLSLEKAEEILGNFNRHLAQYDFSRSKLLVEKLFFLRKEILDHFALNPSRQIEIIKNIIELQLAIFCQSQVNTGFDVELTLQQTRKKINELPDSASQKKWDVTIDFLSFEYYRKLSPGKAQQFYESVNLEWHHLLLYTGICLTSRFAISKLRYLQERLQIEDLLVDYKNKPLLDEHDAHAKVLLGIYDAMLSYYSGKTKEAINILNDIINSNSFKDYFHINLEIKLTLAFFYVIQKDFDLAENIIKSLSRKIKSEELEQYANVGDLIKLLNTEVGAGAAKRNDAKQKDLLTLFTARNTGEFEVLQHLQAELKMRYLK